MRACWKLALLLVGFAMAASPARAQITFLRSEQTREVSAGGQLIGPATLDSTTASLLRPDGSALVIFRTENTIGPGLGLETNLGFRISGGVWGEVNGAWSRTQLRTRVSDDVESVGAQTITGTLFRFSVEGAVLRYFAEQETLSFFVRGGAGWMRELAGDSVLVEDGVVAHAGVGFRHWFREYARGRLRKAGVRVEFRANIRSAGVSFGEQKLRVSPAAAGNLVFGF